MTYGRGGVLSTLAVNVLVLRGLWAGSTSQTVRLGPFQITRQHHQEIAFFFYCLGENGDLHGMS